MPVCRTQSADWNGVAGVLTQSAPPEQPVAGGELSAQPSPWVDQVTAGFVGVCVDGVVVQNATGAGIGSPGLLGWYPIHPLVLHESANVLQEFEVATAWVEQLAPVVVQLGELEARNDTSQWTGPSVHVHREHVIAGVTIPPLADRTCVGADEGHAEGTVAGAPA